MRSTDVVVADGDFNAQLDHLAETKRISETDILSSPSARTAVIVRSGSVLITN